MKNTLTSKLSKINLVGLAFLFTLFLGLGQTIDDGGLLGLVTQLGLIVVGFIVILLPVELLLQKVWGISIRDFF